MPAAGTATDMPIPCATPPSRAGLAAGAAENAGNASEEAHNVRSISIGPRFEHLLDCIEDDREPMTSGAEATRVQEIIEAAYESSRTGKRQEVSG